MAAYYNEIDAYAAQWLRNLIDNNLIAKGEVDERSIRDVAPDDLVGYTQCHFFAGVGVWSHALRLAGWPDDREVWTGSCPCQPFSAAGQRGGVDDARHLWPDFFRLIGERRPPVVFGEQVASKDGLGWLDLVHADMESAGYALGAIDLCAAGVGAPHIRQRLWFVGERLEHTAGDGRIERRSEPGGRGAIGGCGVSGLADATIVGRIGRRTGEAGDEPGTLERSERLRDAGGLADANDEGLEGRERVPERAAERAAGTGCVAGGLDDAAGARHVGAVAGPEGHSRDEAWLRMSGAGRGAGGLAVTDKIERGWGTAYADRQSHGPQGERDEGDGISAGSGVRGVSTQPACPTNGVWRGADWLYCRDGKWRAVEPGTFPLVNGAPARVGRLRAYGNAIVAPLAAEVIGAFLDARP